MEKVNKLQSFGAAEEGDTSYLKRESSELGDMTEEDALKTLFNSEQISTIKSAIKEVGKGCFKYISPSMSVCKIGIVKECYKLGEDYVQQLLSFRFTDEQAEAALYAYQRDFNMVEQLNAGEKPENVKLITDAINTPGFILMDYFDETGSYLSYEKVKDFLGR